MISTFAGIIQAVTILLGMAFGVLGILSKRDDGPLKKSDKVALVGIVVAGALALVAFTIESVRKTQEREAELKSVAKEVARQGQLLKEVQRSLRSIKEFEAKADYTVSSLHPKLSHLIAKWDAYIDSAKPSQFDARGYSLDGTLFISKGKQGSINRLYVTPNSYLFPKVGSTEHGILFPSFLSLAILRADAPKVEAIALQLPNIPRKNPYIDLALLMPFSLVNYTSPEFPKHKDEIDSRVLVRLRYDRVNHLITVSGTVKSATAIADTGAIVSLMDLPSRQIVLTGLKSEYVTGIESFTLTASTGSGRFWSGHKEVRGKQIKIFKQDDRIFASYVLKKDDFLGLATLPFAGKH